MNSNSTGSSPPPIACAGDVSSIGIANDNGGGGGGSGCHEADDCQDEDDDSSSSAASSVALLVPDAATAAAAAAAAATAAMPAPAAGAATLDDALEHFRRNWRQELAARRGQQRQPPPPPRLQPDPPLQPLQQPRPPPQPPQGYRHHHHTADDSDVDEEHEDAAAVDTSQTAAAARQAEEEEIEEEEEERECEEAAGANQAADNDEDQEAASTSLFPRAHSSAMGAGSAHLSDLPMECLLLIVRWLVGARQLDYRSLCRLAGVCRGFDRLAHDRLLWSLIGRQLWGVPYAARDFVLGRAQPLFDGVYIGRCSYVRIGERDVGRCYRPCFLIEYYRYLRFHPPEQGAPLRGRVHLLTANEPPEAVVPCLSQQADLLHGEYTFNLPASEAQPCLLQCVFHSRQAGCGRRGGGGGGGGSWERCIDYYCDFQVKPAKKSRRNCVIQWLRYEMAIRSSIHDSCVTEFNVADAKAFPAFQFARVRSYTRECCDQHL